MAKKFTRKKLRLRARARIRNHSIKVAPKTFGLEKSLQQENLAVLGSLEKKVAEAAAKA